MLTGNGHSPMNGSLTPRHDEDISLSNPTSTNSNKDGFRNLVVQSGSSAPIRNTAIIRTSQGQLLLVANAGGLPFAQNNVAVPVQIPQQIINNISVTSSSVAAVPPDPVPPSIPILRHPTPPPAFVTSPAPQQQLPSSGLTTIGGSGGGGGGGGAGILSTSHSVLANQLSSTTAQQIVGQNVVINSTPSSGNSTQMMPSSPSQQQDAEKKKCISFLKTLLKLAKDKGGGNLITEVSNLVGGLLANRISPQTFTDKIQAVLNSKPQPHLLPFLENMLPSVQKAFYAGEFTFEGWNGPAINASPSISHQQTMSTTSIQPQIQIQHHQNNQQPQQKPPQMPTYIHPPTIRPLISTTNNNVGLSPNPGMTASPIPGPYLVATPSSNIVRPIIPGPTLQHPSTVQPRLQYPSVAKQLLSSGAAGGGPVSTTTTPSPNIIQRHPLTRPAITKTTPGLTTSANTNLHRPLRPPAVKTGGAAGKSQTQPGHPPPAPATPEKYREPEDDINDVAAMGGVNLAEESQKIMASTAEILSTETRSCGKDEDFLFNTPLATKIRSISQKYGLQETRSEVLSLISHATQERLKDLVEKLALIAEHRTEPLRNNPLYEQVTDVRSQLRFLEDLSKKDYLKREEKEKEMVLKMARSRSSKLGDTEQQRMKERAKELQKAEQEEMRNRDANTAALAALSSVRKRPAAAMSSSQTSSDTPGTSNANQPASTTTASSSNDGAFRTQVNRPRFKRVNLRDLQLLLSQEREARQSKTFYRSFYK